MADARKPAGRKVRATRADSVTVATFLSRMNAANCREILHGKHHIVSVTSPKNKRQTAVKALRLGVPKLLAETKVKIRIKASEICSPAQTLLSRYRASHPRCREREAPPSIGDAMVPTPVAQRRNIARSQ